MFLLGGDGTGAGGIDVPDDHDPVGMPLFHDLLELDHGPAHLFGVGAGTDAQVHVRRGDAEFREEGFGHFPVIVLAGMHEEVLEPVGIAGNDARKGRDLHEIRPRPHHRHDSESGLHERGHHA